MDLVAVANMIADACDHDDDDDKRKMLLLECLSQLRIIFQGMIVLLMYTVPGIS